MKLQKMIKQLLIFIALLAISNLKVSAFTQTERYSTDFETAGEENNWTFSGNASIGESFSTSSDTTVLKGDGGADPSAYVNEGIIGYNITAGETIILSYAPRKSIDYGNQPAYTILSEIFYWDNNLPVTIATHTHNGDNVPAVVWSALAPSAAAGKEVGIRFTFVGDWGPEVDDISLKTESPELIWNFEEGSGTAIGDSSGNGFNGTKDPGSTWESPGADGSSSAIGFTSADDNITVPDVPVNSTFYLSAWIKPTAVTAGLNQVIMSQAGVFAFRQKADRLSLTTPGVLDYGTSGTGALLTVGNWHKVECEFTADTTGGPKLYIDGTLVHTQNSTGISSGNATEPLYIADAPFWGGQDFEGSIDQVIYSKQIPERTTTNPDYYSVAKNETLIVAAPGVLPNDTPLNGDTLVPLTGELTTEGGVVTLLADGSFNYTPATDFTGLDTFNYNLGGAVGVVTISVGELIHSYNFDENSGTALTDGTGMATGIITNATWDSTNKHDGVSSLSFNGTDAYVDLDTAAALSGVTDFTVSAWIKTSTVTEAAVVVQRDADVTWNGQWNLKLNNQGKVSFNIFNRGDFSVTSSIGGPDSDGVVTDGEWHNIVGIRQGYTIKIYIDDELAGTATDTSVKAVNSAIGVSIGADLLEGNRHFTGNIDDVKIFNYALSETEVHDNFTPAIGVNVVQNGTEIVWSVEDEVGVSAYHVVDSKTGEVLAIVSADGSTSYNASIPAGSTAKLIVVDHSGFRQIFYPENGNICTVSYNLEKGWNLITIPVENSDVESLKKVTSGEFWSWTGESYQLTTQPEPTQGVWVYAAEAVTTTVSGEKSIRKMVVNRGWNLVGPVNNETIPSDALLIYSWNQLYEEVANNQEVLLQGVGYWIFSL